jgi:hypothetical protein
MEILAVNRDTRLEAIVSQEQGLVQRPRMMTDDHLSALSHLKSVVSTGKCPLEHECCKKLIAMHRRILHGQLQSKSHMSHHHHRGYIFTSSDIGEFVSSVGDILSQLGDVSLDF